MGIGPTKVPKYSEEVKSILGFISTAGFSFSGNQRRTSFSTFNISILYIQGG
jgi:hypothetical protein